MVRIMRTGRMQVTCNGKDGNTRLLSTQFQLLETDGFTILPVTQMLLIFTMTTKTTVELQRWLSGQCCVCMSLDPQNSHKEARHDGSHL